MGFIFMITVHIGGKNNEKIGTLCIVNTADEKAVRCE